MFKIIKYAAFCTVRHSWSAPAYIFRTSWRPAHPLTPIFCSYSIGQLEDCYNTAVHILQWNAIRYLNIVKKQVFTYMDQVIYGLFAPSTNQVVLLEGAFEYLDVLFHLRTYGLW